MVTLKQNFVLLWVLTNTVISTILSTIHWACCNAFREISRNNSCIPTLPYFMYVRRVIRSTFLELFFYSTKLFIVFHLKKTNAPDVSPVSLISPVGKN